jgi:hypothetical protein
MKLSQLTAKPQLIDVHLDDEDTIKEFGESIEFWTWDRQPMETFMKLANADHGNTASIVEIVKTLILDENGKQILTDNAMLPTNVLMKVISKVTELLGK